MSSSTHKPMTKPKISTSTQAYFFFACCILLLPLPWLLAASLAAAVHEACHILAVRLCGGHITQLRIGAMGAVIETAPMSGQHSALCVLAGPLGGLLLTSLYPWFPRLAFCAGLQSLWNLLPVYPMDGGRVLRAALTPVCTERTRNRIETLISVLISAIVLFLAIRLRLFLAAAAATALLFRKMPCKPAGKRLQ